MATEAHGIVTNWSSSINAVFTAETHDCMDAGVRAPKVGALGDAWSNCRKNAEFKYPLINLITTIPANAGIQRNHAAG